MRKRKQGLSLLGILVVVALGVMAFASSAQALVPKFFVGGTLAATGLNAPVEGKQIGTGTLLVKALNLEINCTGFKVTSGLLTSATHAEGSLLYEGCTALEMPAPTGSLAEISTCELIVTEADKRHHVTAKGLILPAELTNGSPAVLVEKIEALVLFLKGVGCALPLENKVKGELCLKIVNNETVKPTVEASEAIQAECKERPTLESLSEGAGVKDLLLYGAQTSFVDGKAEVFLGGGATHLGKTIGVLLD